MNILVVSNYYPNNNDTQFCIFIQQQAEALSQLGHNVEVIVPYAVGSLKEQIHQETMSGVPVYYAQYFTLYKKIYSRFALMRNIKVLEQFFDFSKYDVISIHMFDEFTLRIFSRIADIHHIKLVVHYHGLSILYDQPISFLIQLLQRRGNRVLRKLVEKADAVVGVSEKVCERVSETLSIKSVFTVYNGVNTKLFQPSDTKYEDFTIISVASLKKIKGNHYLIDAVKRIKETYANQNIRLKLIGRGPEKEALLSQIREYHMEHIVELIGYINYEEVAKILPQCNVFAMPSYYEALGCAYLEAMACKLPVIGCKNQGIDEIVKDGINGFLIDPHDVNQLFEKLEYLLMHKNAGYEIGLNGYYTVIKNFTWQDSAKSLVKVYQQLL